MCGHGWGYQYYGNMNPQSISLSLFVLLLCLYVSLPLRSGRLAGVHQCPHTHTGTHTHTHCGGVAGSQAWSRKLSSSPLPHTHTNMLNACTYEHILANACTSWKWFMFVVTYLHADIDSLAHKHTDTQRVMSNQFSSFRFLSHAQVSTTTYAMCMRALDCVCACHFLSLILLSFSIPTRLVAPLPCKQSQV